MKSAKRWACVLAVLGVLGGVGGVGAWGQPNTPTTPPTRPGRGLPPKPAPKPAEPAPAPTTPDPNAPGTQPNPSAPTAPAPAAPAAQPKPPAGPATKSKEAPIVGPYVKQVLPRDLTLVADVRIHLDNSSQKQSFRDPFSGKSVDMPQITPMKFQTMGFIFPLVVHTGSTDLFQDDYKGLLRINGHDTTDQFRVLTGYPTGTKLAEWEAGSQDSLTEARQVELHVEIPQRCYNTALDEAGAMEVTWPTMAFPPEAASCLTPQLWIEAAFDDSGRLRMYDDKLVKEAMKEIFEDHGLTDLKRVPPVRVAKMIAEKVWGEIQINGEGMVFMRTGEFAGMDLQSPGMTLDLKKGSEQDVAVLVCALLKKAGLPARPVIGFDINSRSDNKFLNKGSKSNRLRTWVEFALFDEAKNTINWVPVDVARMRKTTSRPTPIERPWPYFGTHDELSFVPVLAVTFHPPTDVVAYGAPAFWGWFVTPAPATNAEQGLRFQAAAMAKKGGEDERDPKNPQKDDKKKMPVKKGY